MGACQAKSNKIYRRTQSKSFVTDYDSKQMIEWSIEEVYHWIQTVCDGELSSIAIKFKKNRVDGKLLKKLTDKDIRKLIDDEYFFVRFKLLRHAQQNLDITSSITNFNEQSLLTSTEKQQQINQLHHVRSIFFSGFIRQNIETKYELLVKSQMLI